MKNPGEPPVSVLRSTASGISPPRKLGAAGLALWSAIQSDYRIDDQGGIEMLTQACEASDEIAVLTEEIQTDGAVIRTRTGPKSHPALRDVLQHRAFIVRTLERLGLNVEAVKSVGRPSGAAWRGRDHDD